MSGKSASSLPPDSLPELPLSADSKLELRALEPPEEPPEDPPENDPEPELKAEDNMELERVGEEGLIEESWAGAPLKLLTPTAPALPLLPPLSEKEDDGFCLVEAA
jgi:hypothetical protein